MRWQAARAFGKRAHAGPIPIFSEQPRGASLGEKTRKQLRGQGARHRNDEAGQQYRWSRGTKGPSDLKPSKSVEQHQGAHSRWQQPSSEDSFISLRAANQKGSRRAGWSPSAPPAWEAAKQQREGDAKLRQVREGWRGDALYGIYPVQGALTAKRRSIHELYIQEGAGAAKATPEVQQILNLAQAEGVPVRYLSKHDLNILTDNSAHQGVVLDCSPLGFVPKDDFGDAAAYKHPCVWLALDEVTDPHNLGATLRSACFLGISGVLTCSRNSAPLSPAVSKVSAGAMEHLPVHSCRAMQKTLQLAADQGWDVLGAAAERDAVPCSEVSLSKPSILVLGSERKGLRTTVKRACKQLVKVDNLGTQAGAAGLDSLNVSVAAGILIHQLMRSA